jgi:hypothetical protein
LSACSLEEPPTLAVNEAAIAICGLTHSSGRMTVGVTAALSEVDLRVVSIAPVGGENLEVLGWYSMPPTEHVGLGDGFTSLPDAEDGTAELIAENEVVLEVGVGVLDIDQEAAAEAFVIEAESTSGMTVTRNVSTSLRLLPEGEVC